MPNLILHLWLTFAAFFFQVPGQTPVGIFSGGANGFSFHRRITIDHNQVGASDSSAFPVLVTGTFTYLKTTGNGGSVTNSSGFDIVFTSDSSCTATLNFQRRFWSATTGQVLFWVNVATVSHTTDTVFYECYGKSSISTDQSNTTGTYDSNYKAVAQSIDVGGGTPSVVDVIHSIGFGNNGSTPATLSTSGPLIYAIHFPGNAYFNTEGSSTNSAMPVGTAVRTLSVWFNVPSPNTGNIFMWGTNAGADRNYGFFVNTTSLFVDCNTDSINAAWTQDSNWHYLVATLPSGTTCGANKMYLDGTPLSTSANSGTMNTGSFEVIMGANVSKIVNFLTGDVTEARVSDSARSADWITAEYNNQKLSSTFLTISSPL